VLKGWPWLILAAVATILAGAYAGIQYSRRGDYRAEVNAKSARRVAEAVEAKQKAFDEAAADAQAKRDRESAEVEARERDTKLAEDERARTAAAEANRKANEEKRDSEERSRRQADTQREAASKVAEGASKARTEEQARRPDSSPIRIGSYWQADSDCQPRPVARVAIIQPPRYGKAESRAETMVAEKSRTGRCVGTKQNAIAVLYSASSGSVTEDRLSIEVRYESATRTFDCVVNVKDRSATCRSVY
jgi:ATPase subunit of ABC transporter with duplicated ATPase domains